MEDETERREARIVGALLLMVVLVGSLYVSALALQFNSERRFITLLTIGLGITAVLVASIAYALTRRGRTRLGARLLTSLVVLSAWLLTTVDVLEELPYPGTTLLLSAITAVTFLRAREYLVVHGLNLLFMVIIQLILPISANEWVQVILVYIIGAAILSVRYFLTELSLQDLERYVTEWRGVMETSDAGIVSLDRDFHIHAFNDNAQELATAQGLPPLRQGARAFDLLPATVQGRFVDLVAPAMAGQTIRELCQFNGTNEREVELSLTIKPLLNRMGSRVGISMLIRDVTEELQNRRKAEQRLAETRAAVLNSASHEINTPLTPLVIQLSLLRQERLGRLTDAQRKALDIADRNVRSLRRNVDAFLKVTRLEQDLANATSEEVNLSELIHSWVQSSHGAATVDITPEILVQGDHNLLESAMQGLVDTMLRWSDDDQLGVSVATDNDQAILVVEDPQSTVPEEDRLEMKELLQRDAESIGYAGLMSLHVARRVVANHGGDLRMARGPGLRFEARLPRYVNDNHVGSQRPPRPPRAAKPSSTPPTPLQGQEKKIHPSMRSNQP